jgi:hypothetical protein
MVCLELAHTRLKLTVLSALIDAWNEVCHHSIVYFHQWLIQLSPQVFIDAGGKRFEDFIEPPTNEFLCSP